jgi:2-oxoisovalerate dehydrogenase E1 component
MADPNYQGFSKSQLLDVYRKMYLSRTLDEKLLLLLRQGKIYIHVGASGHEAAQVAAAMNFLPGKDWAYCYYRDQAFVMNWGLSPKEVLLLSFGKADDPSSSGRQAPGHWGHHELRLVSRSACTGVQYLQAVGTAMGAKKAGKDEVVYVSGGKGSTSEGEFFEALNWASRDRLPVIFHIQDN